MALTVVSVTLDGVALPLDQVAADITIRHGRSSYYDGPTAATAQVTVLGATRSLVRGITLSKPLVVNYSVDGAAAKPRFTGRTTDATLDDDALTIIAVGRLSTLDGYTVGGYLYAQETWTTRVTRLFSDAGILSALRLNVGTFNPVLISRPAGNPLGLAAYLDDLLGMIGGIMYDAPDGTITIESPGVRTTDNPVHIGPDIVAYAPRWQKVLPGYNQATCGYGGPGLNTGTVTATDTDAVTLYGPRPVTVTPSEIANKTDAQSLVDSIVARQADPRWSTPAAVILDPLDITVGQAVQIPQLPAAAPYGTWTGIVEGWTDNIGSDGRSVAWTMELNLSDPALVGAPLLAWADVPTTGYAWDQINQVTAWDDATTLDTITPVPRSVNADHTRT